MQFRVDTLIEHFLSLSVWSLEFGVDCGEWRMRMGKDKVIQWV